MKKKNKKIINNKIRDLLLNQKGMALLTTLIFVFILVTFAVALLIMTGNDTKLSALQRDSTKAFYIAEAGMERTLYNLEKDYESYQEWGHDNKINGYPLETTNGFQRIEYVTGYDVTFGDGTYTVALKINGSKNVTIKSKGKYNKSTRYVQVDATVGPLSVWDNAIFAGAGKIGRVINGNVDIRGSVHLLGEEGEGVTMDIGVEIGGTGSIGNNYHLEGPIPNVVELFDRKINSLPTTILNEGEEEEEVVETLDAELRVRHGNVNLSGTATVGDPDIYGNLYKETLDGVYINDEYEFGGNQGVNNVYSDDGIKSYDDFVAGTFEFPILGDPYIDPDTGSTVDENEDGLADSYIQYYDTHGLKMYDPADSPEAITVSSISSDTESFWYSNPENATPPDPDNLPLGDYIYWHKEERKLYISGIMVIHEDITDFTIGDKGNPIDYVGVGTIVSTKGDISIHGDLLAKNLFPTTDALGLVAYNNLNFATGDGDSQLKMMGAFYAQEQITSAKQNKIAGTFVSNYFDMGGQVPSIYQVPDLIDNIPPGMPGAWIDYNIYTSKWHEVHK